MNRLQEILQTGGHSLVLRTATGSIRTFDGRGVSDLHALYHDPSHPLTGAEIADKVVGMGAAVLMIAGGVTRCRTNVISHDALILMQNAGMACEYNTEVPEIINRKGTGRCPLETRLAPLCDIQSMIAEIDRFVDETAHHGLNS